MGFEDRMKERTAGIGRLLFAVLSLFVFCMNVAGAAEDREQALQSLVMQASSAQARGDFTAAADAYQKSVGIDPSIPQLWANLGLMYHQVGKRAEAVQSFKRAIQLNPSLFVPQLFLGIEYLAAQEPNEALPYLQRAVKLNPKDVQASVSIGRAYALLDRGNQAAEAYRSALQLAPQDGKIWLSLGISYLQQVENDARLMNARFAGSPYVKLRAAETFAEQGKLVEAETAYRTALAVPTPAPCAHAEYAISLLRTKRFEDAKRNLELEEADAAPCALRLLVESFRQLAVGNTDVGVDSLAALASTDPAFIKTSTSLFRDVLSPERMNLALDAVRKKQAAGQVSPNLGELIQRVLAMDTEATQEDAPDTTGATGAHPNISSEAVMLSASGNYSGCTNVLRRSPVKLTDRQQKLLASCAFFSGEYQAASIAAEALKANPSTFEQGLYWESKADQQLAVAALSRAGELEPNSPEMWVLIGDVYRQKRRWSEAEADYRKAIALDPKSRSARLSLAIVLFTELRNDEAFALDESLLDEMPNDAEANLLAGEILVQQHEFERAEVYLLKCGKLDADLLPRLHVLLGQVYSETNRIPEAVAEYKLGLATDHDGSIHFQLARLYQKEGKPADAAEQIRISKQLREHWDNQAHVALEQRSTDLSRQ
jgi:tetratricopeptide (TPR) repeat protein